MIADSEKLSGRSGVLVSVVLLSYDRPRLLACALDSLAAQTCPGVRVTVVDNESPSSDEIERLVRARPSVELIRTGANLGYAAGMNRGIGRALGRYTFLTEDDVVLDTDCLLHLVEHAERVGEAPPVLAGPLIYNRESGTIRCAGGDLSLGGVFRRTTRGEDERDAGQYAAPFEVTYVDGVTVFAPTAPLRRLGGFREDFFMYGESTELCARATRAGWRLKVVPAAKVYHFEPPPRANISPEFDYHRIKNLFALYLLHAPPRVWPEFFARYAVLGAARALASGGARPFAHALLWAARHAPSLLRERDRPTYTPPPPARVTPNDATRATPVGEAATAAARASLDSRAGWSGRAGAPGGAAALTNFPMNLKDALRRTFYRAAPRGLAEARLRSMMMKQARLLVESRARAGAPPLWIDGLLASHFFRPIQKRAELLRLSGLVAARRPRAVCEIGAAGGGTAFVFADAAHPEAVIVSVDLRFDRARRDAVRLFAAPGQRLVPVEGDSHHEATPRAVADALGGRALDLLYIDGDHSYEGVAADFRMYAPLLGAGGLVVFHDIVPDHRTRHGVVTSSDTGGVPALWRELKARYAGCEEIVEDPAQDGYGLGVLPWPGAFAGSDAAAAGHGGKGARA